MSNGIRSNNNNVFHYCSYWGNWSRILQEGTPHNDGRHIEISVTAINGTTEYDWRIIKELRIRAHGTTRSPRDKFVGTLPQHALEHMREWLDAPLIERLLHEDFLHRIDWSKYQKLCNGGSPFDLILLD